MYLNQKYTIKAWAHEVEEINESGGFTRNYSAYALSELILVATPTSLETNLVSLTSEIGGDPDQEDNDNGVGREVLHLSLSKHQQFRWLGTDQEVAISAKIFSMDEYYNYGDEPSYNADNYFTVETEVSDITFSIFLRRPSFDQLRDQILSDKNYEVLLTSIENRGFYYSFDKDINHRDIGIIHEEVKLTCPQEGYSVDDPDKLIFSIDSIDIKTRLNLPKQE